MTGKKKILEWDDVPKKAVGKRRAVAKNKNGYELQKLANSISEQKVSWPKGVFRFTSYESAEKWWIDQMIITK